MPYMLSSPVLDSRWDERKDSRQQVILVLVTYFVVSGCVRVVFEEYRTYTFASTILALLFLLPCMSSRVRNKKTGPYACAIAFDIAVFYNLIQVVLIATTGSPWGSLESNETENEFMCRAPLRSFLQLIWLSVVAAMAGLSVRFILINGAALLANAVVVLVCSTSYLKMNLTSPVICLPLNMVMIGFLVLYLIHKQEKLRLRVIAQMKESQKNTEDWVLREEQLQHEKDQAISYIFHEVRNPVNAISMAAELAITTLSPHTHPERLTLLEMMDNIVKATDLATIVLNDVLNVQHLQAGTFSFASIPFNLVESHRQVIRLLQYQMTNKQIDFSCHIDESLEGVTVIGDGNRLKQVVQNFLNNASKFTPHGGRIRVFVERLPLPQPATESEKGTESSTGKSNDCEVEFIRVRTSVTNDGPVIGENERSKIFHPWKQLRAGEHHGGGSGLGLAICKDFVEKGFGGIIDFTSTVAGTTFFFDINFKVHSVAYSPELTTALPTRHVSHASASPQYLQTHCSTTFDVEMPPISQSSDDINVVDMVPEVFDVMVVEDSLMNRTLLIRILTSFGMNCVSCENGQQAVDMLTGVGERFVKCRIVLMDKEMPVMDGYVATETLRANPIFSGHIIGVTGNALDSQVSEFLSKGVDEVITKPVKSSRIQSMLMQYGLLKTEVPLLWSPLPPNRHTDNTAV